MKETATVKIFLAQGDPSSIRTAEISNWTGKAVSGPRSQLDLVLQRNEASKPGVYFLTGINPEAGKDLVYIGEAEVIRSSGFKTSGVWLFAGNTMLTTSWVSYSSVLQLYYSDYFEMASMLNCCSFLLQPNF